MVDDPLESKYEQKALCVTYVREGEGRLFWAMISIKLEDDHLVHNDRSELVYLLLLIIKHIGTGIS